ncbi:TPA: hypothetical protein QDZ75_002924 [Stenotrophomonas maltophilia]|jgi:hypothetical protein|uniref:hypothetical protein n=1 Tax=Stenotrophomonas maltophilia TaxID=40324 RepID=UPI002A930E0A|nr:hypothetical protein [Stenotrophomonas maltophilia]HEL5402790.1 hypothetical protein [Stenotrophomonas maltophilia]
MNNTPQQNQNDRSNTAADAKQTPPQGQVDGDEPGGNVDAPGQQQQQDNKDREPPKPGQEQKGDAASNLRR